MCVCVCVCALIYPGNSMKNGTLATFTYCLKPQHSNQTLTLNLWPTTLVH